MTNAAHTPGPWRVFEVFTDIEIVADRPTAHETESIVQFKGQRNARANARIMSASPVMLDVLTRTAAVIKQATDIIHYEDGAPVTALEGWEIERAYTALCGALTEVHEAIAEAQRVQP